MNIELVTNKSKIDDGNVYAHIIQLSCTYFVKKTKFNIRLLSLASNRLTLAPNLADYSHLI